MTRKLMIVPLVYLMVQAVAFGIGMLTLVATPLAAHASDLMPWMIALTFVVSVPIAVLIAPRLQARREITVHAPTV